MPFFDLKIRLGSGKRFRLAGKNKGNADCKPELYIHDECPDDTVPATSVMNILAVLAGKRPWKRSAIENGEIPQDFNAFKQLAGQARIEISTPCENREIMKSLKASHSATKETWTLNLDGNNYPIVRNRPTYETVKATLETADWENLDGMLKKVFGYDYRSNVNSGASTVPSMIEKLRKAYIEGNKEAVRFCEHYGDTKTKLKDLVIVPVTTGTPTPDGDGYKVFRIDSPIGKNVNEKVLHTKTNTHGIITAQVVSGTLHVKVTDADLEMFRNGPGFATFLDGGVAEIESLDLEYWQPETDNLPAPFTTK